MKIVLKLAMFAFVMISAQNSFAIVCADGSSTKVIDVVANENVHAPSGLSVFLEGTEYGVIDQSGTNLEAGQYSACFYIRYPGIAAVLTYASKINKASDIGLE